MVEENRVLPYQVRNLQQALLPVGNNHLKSEASFIGYQLVAKVESGIWFHSKGPLPTRLAVGVWSALALAVPRARVMSFPARVCLCMIVVGWFLVFVINPVGAVVDFPYSKLSLALVASACVWHVWVL